MTQTNISETRKKFIKSIVAEACEHFNTPKLPLQIKSFVRSYHNIRLVSYKKHMRRMGYSYERLISIAKDSFTDYYADQNMFYIYYNDMDNNINNSYRYRWNIAHELGHVLLNHFDNEKTRILRSSLSDNEYSELEEEADYFAQLILVPHAALLGFRINSAKDIRTLCKISDPASKRRFYEFQIWKSHVNPEDEYDKRIFAYYYDFIFKKKCKICNAVIIQRRGKHCPICGFKNTLEWRDEDDMKYPMLPTHENQKLTECPKCKNEETEISGNYCQICGTNLVNQCTNFACESGILPSNARYCPICGERSTFFANGILSAWRQPSDAFLSIPDGFDEELPFN